MEQLLNSILRCLTAGKDSYLVRKEILEIICQNFEASGAKWFIQDSLKPGLAEAERVLIQVGIHESSNNSSSVNLEIGTSAEIYSTMSIFFRDELQSSHDFSPIVRLLALLEENLRLKQHLGTSRSNLQNLSKESEGIAEKNAKLFQQLIANENRMRGISRGIVKMQEEERARISRELHDGVGQALLAIKMHLDILSDTTTSAEHVKEARTLAEQTLEEVRELSRLLRPRMLDDLGLLPTLRWYVRTYTERTGINVSLDTDGIDQRLNSDVETMFFRVTQEGLNNVFKHSNAKNVTIQIHATPENISFELLDNGRGFTIDSADQNEGSGLVGIRDRVTLLGGEFTLSSVPGEGTKLQVKLPVLPVVIKNKARRG